MPHSNFLPFAEPYIEQEEIDAVIKTLRSGWLTQGPRVSEFEKAFSSHLNGNMSIALSSATAALHLCLLSLGIGPGDEVITTPFTFASTANAVEIVGAKTVFADIENETLNIDVSDVENKITSRTKAIIVVHFAGLPCDMERVRALARKRNLILIEDAAHALGASYDGEAIGASSEFAAFSFYPIKNITAIEGGMLVTNRSDLIRKIKIMRWYGLSEAVWERLEEGADRYSEVVEPGLKYNMNDVQAAVGLVQLGRLSMLNQKRRLLADHYLHLLQDVRQLRLPIIRDKRRQSSCHLFVARVDPRSGLGRQELAAELKSRNIGTSYHYRSLHLHPYYRDKYELAPTAFPVAAQASEEVLSLPLFPRMGMQDVERVVGAIKDAFAHR